MTPDIQKKVFRLAPPILNIIIILALAHTLANLSRQLLNDPILDPPPLPTAAVPTPADPTEKLVNWHMFGKVAKKVVVAPKAAPKAPPKQLLPPLPLRLRGIFYIPTIPEKARALIYNPKLGAEDMYMVGQIVVEYDAEIIQILPDRVLLKRKTQTDTLWLKDANTTAEDSVPVKKVEKKVDLKKYLGEIRRTLLSDPNSLEGKIILRMGQPGPAYKGVGIYPGKDRKILGLFGLKSGDQVSHINGKQLTGNLYKDGVTLLSLVPDMKNVKLRVYRRGENLNFLFPVGD